jgi:hypothetical protein
MRTISCTAWPISEQSWFFTIQVQNTFFFAFAKNTPTSDTVLVNLPFKPQKRIREKAVNSLPTTTSLAL